MGEIVFLVVLLIISAVCFQQTFTFGVSILDQSGGPAVFPRIVIALLVIAVVIRLITVLREKKHEHFVFIELFTGKRLFFFLSLILYIVTFKFLGYILSTCLFLMITCNYFYYVVKENKGSLRSIVLRNTFVVVFSVGMYFFFGNVLHIMLPAGILG